MNIRRFTRICVAVLLLWFMFAVTGLSFGNTIFAVRDFDLITFIWFVLYTAAAVLFYMKEKSAKYILAVFLFIWTAMQSLNFFASPSGIASYNKLFENHHYIIPPSETMLIPDTYHLILLFLIVLTLAVNIIFIINSKRAAGNE